MDDIGYLLYLVVHCSRAQPDWKCKLFGSLEHYMTSEGISVKIICRI